MPDKTIQTTLFPDQVREREITPDWFSREPVSRPEPPVDKPAPPRGKAGENITLVDLGAEAAGCNACRLRAGCRGVVFGEGSPTARLLLVGEGPGQREDELGRPFIGKAGQLLDRILTAAGIAREEVYITNVVKCRPPANRLPQPDEVAACRRLLDQQIQAINPAIIVCLGALATQTLTSPDNRITRVRGQVFESAGRKIIPTFHPAALLRDESKKRPVWEDFQKIRDLYRGLPGG